MLHTGACYTKLLSDSLAIRYSETGFGGRGRPRPGRFQAYYRRIRASPLRSSHFICRFGILISGVGGRAGGPRKFGGREILATRSGPLAPGPGGSRKLPGGSRRPPGAGIFPKDSRRLPGGSSPEAPPQRLPGGLGLRTAIIIPELKGNGHSNETAVR